MISEKYASQVLCSKCGQQCYRLCYVGERVVCVDCFRIACEKAHERRPRKQPA